MIETIIVSFLIAKFKGYKVFRAFYDWSLWPMFTLTIAYIFLEVYIFTGHTFLLSYAKNFETVYIISLIIPMCRHQSYFQGIVGVCFVFVGSGANRLVMYANEGKMPIYPSLTNLTGYSKLLLRMNDGRHFVANSNVKLKILTDWIDTGYCIMSIGDILIRVYVGIIIYYSIKALNRV